MIILNRKYVAVLGLAFKAVTSRSLCACSNTVCYSPIILYNCLQEIMLINDDHRFTVRNDTIHDEPREEASQVLPYRHIPVWTMRWAP